MISTSNMKEYSPLLVGVEDCLPIIRAGKTGQSEQSDCSEIKSIVGKKFEISNFERKLYFSVLKYVFYYPFVSLEYFESGLILFMCSGNLLLLSFVCTTCKISIF